MLFCRFKSFSYTEVFISLKCVTIYRLYRIISAAADLEDASLCQQTQVQCASSHSQRRFPHEKISTPAKSYKIHLRINNYTALHQISSGGEMKLPFLSHQSTILVMPTVDATIKRFSLFDQVGGPGVKSYSSMNFQSSSAAFIQLIRSYTTSDNIQFTLSYATCCSLYILIIT